MGLRNLETRRRTLGWGAFITLDLGATKYLRVSNFIDCIDLKSNYSNAHLYDIPLRNYTGLATLQLLLLSCYDERTFLHKVDSFLYDDLLKFIMNKCTPTTNYALDLK